MRKILFLFIVSSVFIFAQKSDKDNQNVELPDFVITGTEKVSVDKVKKADPELIPITSEEFIKPSFSPEELELKKFSNPLKKDINFSDSVHYKKGYLDAAAGNNKLLSGKFIYSAPFSAGIFNGQISGLYGRPYIENADKVSINGNAELGIMSGSNSPFFPGSEYIFRSGYDMKSYKLFASLLPETKRTVYDVNGGVGFRNFESNHFQTALDADAHFISLNKEPFIDRMFSIKGYGNLQTEHFLLSLETGFKTISVSNSFVSDSASSFFSILPKMGLRISDLFKAELGIYFSRGAGVTFSYPYVSMALRLDKSISMFIEYNPYAEYINAGEYLKINPYMDLRKHYNQYTKYDGSLSVGVKYEYEKYFQINAGASYKSSDMFKYFAPSSAKGYFTVANADARIYGVSLDLLYHLGPMGYLYGKIDLKASQDTAKRTVPYIPAVTSKISYGYTFSTLKLDSEISLLYRSEVYTNIGNTGTLPQYVDLGLKFSYNLKPRFNFTLEFSNILNSNNYIWNGYREMPVNVSAGIRYLL